MTGKTPASPRALIKKLSDKRYQLETLFAMAAAPHPDYVPALVAYHMKLLDDKRKMMAEFGDDFGHAWDDEQVLRVLAKVGDDRAVPLLEALLVQARRVSWWDLVLEACERTDVPALVPALVAFRDRSAAESPNWPLLPQADRVIAALRHSAKKRGLPIPEAPSIAPLSFAAKSATKKPHSKKSQPKKKTPQQRNPRKR